MNNQSPIKATLVICALAAAVGSFALFRSADTAPVAAQPAPQAQVADGYSGYGAIGDDGAEAAQVAAPATITISDFSFEVSGSVQPGQTITVINNDGVPHTVTAADGSFDTGTLAAGQSVQLVVPDTAGAHPFFCAIHPSMTGNLNVA